MKIRQHEFPDGKFCKYCGCLQHAEMTATCLERDGPAPEPTLRRIACEDSDAIMARLAELKAQRDEILAMPLEGET